MSNVTTKKLTKVTKYCDECDGCGGSSSCCGEPMEYGDDRCYCGKFATYDICGACEGHGRVEFKVGDYVEVFVCIYSDKYLFELYKPKKLGDAKYFYGTIREIIDDRTVLVKLEGKRNKREIKVQDLMIT